MNKESGLESGTDRIDRPEWPPQGLASLQLRVFDEMIDIDLATSAAQDYRWVGANISLWGSFGVKLAPFGWMDSHHQIILPPRNSKPVRLPFRVERLCGVWVLVNLQGQFYERLGDRVGTCVLVVHFVQLLIRSGVSNLLLSLSKRNFDIRYHGRGDKAGI